MVQDQDILDKSPVSSHEKTDLRSFGSIKESTNTYRNFNIACILINLLTTAFMAVFLNYLDGLLIAVYVVQFLFCFSNMIFYCTNELVQQNWIRLRRFLIYIPFGILNLIYLYDFFRFFKQLETYNDQFQGGAKESDQDTQMTEAFVTIWLTHFIISPFFQGLSYCVYSFEVSNQLERKNLQANMDPKILSLYRFEHKQIGVQFPKLDYPKINKLVGGIVNILKSIQINIQPVQLKITLDEEFDFQDEYTKIKKQRFEKEEERKLRRQRLYQSEESIRQKQEEMKKLEEEKINLEYVQSLQDKERKELEEERKRKFESESREQKILQVINQFHQVDYDKAKQMLMQANWNLDAVIDTLSRQFQIQKMEEQKLHEDTISLMDAYPQIEYDQAFQTLQKHQGNLINAKNELKQQYSFSINFSMRGPQKQEIELLKSEFNKQDDAILMITYLQSVRPINDSYYKLYRDPHCTQQISYIELSQSFILLGIRSNDTFFVHKDTIPPY
ncbi:UNKNOWN [Stylonychia lemnae]|uniref:Uncharacterized protein n=1 Tax=Stylonychia lemnae TaxID=5949 RepID=A0A078A3G8_STYLE|nr:UNKNOWN [Stylonychia lemnae]|eukprot:CDW76722.1 UNKNOWN [Stylonychia lemnae]